MKVVKVLLLALVAMMGLACGGGGGGSAGGGSSVGFFVTDDMSPSFDHVWVTLDKIELVGATNTATIFDSPGGKVVDLRILNQGGITKFAAVGLAAAPPGPYTSVRITLNKNLKVVPAGGSTASPRTFAGAGATTVVLSFNFPSPVTLGGATTNLVADFDLSQWVDNGTTVTPEVHSRDTSGLNSSNCERDDFEGKVSNLAGTAPTQTFDLLTEHGGLIHITTDASTTIFNSDGSANPALANDQHVQVRGTIDPTTSTVPATSIKIKIGNHEDQAEAHGVVVTATATDMSITIGEVEGFQPTGTTLNIVFTPTTLFFGQGGVSLSAADFATAATATPGLQVEVEGTFDATAQVFTATRAKLEEHDGDDHEHHDGEVRGPVVTVDTVNLAFTMTVNHWEGFSLTMGATLNVVTTPDTHYKLNDSNVDGATFFAALVAGTTVVKVEGSLSADGTTLTASKIEVGSS